jgi:hypothetical protein
MSKTALSMGLLPYYRTQLLGWKCSLCGQTFLLPEPLAYGAAIRATPDIDAAFKIHRLWSQRRG